MVCDRMKWDYKTYCNQPGWFIDMLLAKWKIDAEEHKG